MFKLLAESNRPALRNLRALLAERDRLHVGNRIPEIFTLRKCVDRVNKWVEVANSYASSQGIAPLVGWAKTSQPTDRKQPLEAFSG